MKASASKSEGISDDPAELRCRLEAAEAELQRMKERSVEDLRKLRAELGAVQTKARSGESRLAERFREITSLTVLLRQQEELCEAADERADWLRQVAIVLFTRPGWWGLMPASWRGKRERRLLRARGLFDGDAYLNRNPDVATTGIDPLLHYLFHGITEDRPRSM